MKVKEIKRIIILSILLLIFMILTNINTSNAVAKEVNVYYLKSSNFEYTGKEIRPEPEVDFRLTYQDEETNQYKYLEYNKDYTCIYESDTKSIGEKTIKFKTIGEFKDYTVKSNYKYYITPKKIKNIQIDEITNTTAKISWQRQEDDKGEEYSIQTRGGDPYTVSIFKYKIANLNYKATNLKPGTKYTIGVATSASQKISNYTNQLTSAYTEVSFTTLPNRASDFKVIDIDETKSKISWNGDSNCKFDVYLSMTGEDADYKLISTTTDKYIEIEKDKLKNNYKIKVIAYILDEENRIDAPEGIYTKNITPIAPTELKIKLEKTGLKISWNPISGVKGYKIYKSKSKDSGYTLLRTLSANSFLDTKLSNGAIYYYKVIAYNTLTGTEYCSKYSNIVSMLNIKTPTSLSITSKDTSAKISWTKVSGATGYRIYRATSINGKYKSIKAIKGSSKVSYTDTKLKKYRKYYYKVRAYYTYKGKNYYSIYSQIKTKESLAKVNVSGISYNKKGYNTLKWKKVNKAKGYRIYRATAKNGKYTRIKTTSKLYYNDKKISLGTRYYYKVMAYKGSLNGQLSNIYSKVTGTRIQQLNKLKLKTKSTGSQELDKYLNNMIKRAYKADLGSESGKGKSNYRKIKAIYTYVEKNLRHYKGYNCKDFSGTYCALLNYIGINTYCVEGKTKSGSGWTAHTWVILELNGTKYVFDPSIDRWAAGDKTKKLSYNKFFKTESEVKKSYKKQGKTFGFIDDIISGRLIGYIFPN